MGLINTFPQCGQPDSDGHIIQDNGTLVNQKGTLNFIGFDIEDNDTDCSTDVSQHELSTTELTEIMSTLPGTPMNLPVLFDESGTEYQIGWYKYANGTKKPVYQKTIVDTMPTVTTDGTSVDKYINIGSSIDIVVNSNVSIRTTSTFTNINVINGIDFTNKKIIDVRFFIFPENTQSTTNKNKLLITSRSTSYNDYNFYATIQYTKTTD